MSARLPRAASSRYVAVDLDVGALSSLQACDSIVGYSSCYNCACRARLCEEKGKDIHGGEQEMRERSLVQESGKRRRCVTSRSTHFGNILTNSSALVERAVYQ